MSSKEPEPTKSGSGKDRPPDDLTDTDWAILKHLSLYHLTIRQAVQELFFNSDSVKSGTALDALARQGYLKNREEHTPPQPKKSAKSKTQQKQGNQDADSPQLFRIGSVKYYILGGRSKQLAPKGFRFPKERLVPPNTEQSLYKHLAALWFCIFDGPRRYRLDQEEISALWADTIPDNRKVPHQPAYCLANEEAGPVVYRLYPTQKSNAAQIVEEVRKKVAADIENLGLQRWVESGEYGYAIVVPSTDRQRHVQRELAKLRIQNSPLSQTRLTVHYAPAPPLLAKALKDWGNGNKGDFADTPAPKPNDGNSQQTKVPLADETPDLSSGTYYA